MTAGRYSISVAAELSGLHPQTLRLYEARGLLRPRRTPGGTRRYSDADLDRLHRITVLTGELGLNLAGAHRVLELEDLVDELYRRVERLHGELLEAGIEKRGEVARVHRSYRRELIPYNPPKHPQKWISRS
jgi:MerR family transcriptional regulator, heat shock protein HspR